MGDVKTTIDRSDDLTVNIASGALTVDDILSAAKRYLSEEPTGKVLWDLQDADGSHLSGAEIQKLFEVLSQIPAIAKPRKIALVVTGDLGRGLSRMSEAYSKGESIPAKYFISRSIEEAMQWLDVDSAGENSSRSGEFV